MKKLQLIVMFIALSQLATAQIRPITRAELDSLPYSVLDTMPEYPGGKVALMQYIQDSLNYYPEGNPITGNVFVEIIVEKNGSVSNARVIKSLAEYHDKEALKVIRSMPNFKPGIKYGKPVRTRMVLPVRFTIR